jgi:predicted metal-binding protein
MNSFSDNLSTFLTKKSFCLQHQISYIAYLGCERCGAEDCARGIHAMEAHTIGPGVFLASCMFCNKQTENPEEAGWIREK